MAIPLTNVNMAHIVAELGRPPGTVLDVNDAELRTLATAGFNPQNTTSGTEIDYTDFAGKARIEYTVNGDCFNINLIAMAQSTNNYVPGKTYMTLTIAPGVKVQSSSISAPALDINLTPGDIVEIVNNGYIFGAGGNGGNGSGGSGYNRGWASAGSSGQPGGTAIIARLRVNIANNGNILGGGGGGAGGDGSNTGGKKRGPRAGGGGGGGAGSSPGQGGQGGQASEGGYGNQGQIGALVAGGVGGTAPAGQGGDGGNSGQWGISRNQFGGGAPGYYIQGGSFVTWAPLGNVIGQAG